MKHSSRSRQQQLFWGRVVMRKWLNIPTRESDYSADTDSGEDSDFSDDEFCAWPRRESRFKDDKQIQIDANAELLEGTKGRKAFIPDSLPRLRRRKSETFRAQYINTKEIKIYAGTWNVGGKVPPEDLDLEDWLDVSNPADIYVIGFQEIIPLNAGNIFGAEDNRPVSKWENIIRETLNEARPVTKFKCYSDPLSPSRFKPSEDAPDIQDEIILESDSDGEEEIYPLDEETTGFNKVRVGPVTETDEVIPEDFSVSYGFEQKPQRQFSAPKRLDRIGCFRTEDSEENVEESAVQYNRKLTRTLSGTEKLGFCWPELPLDLLSQRVLERPNSFKSIKSFKASKSFKRYSSFKSTLNDENRTRSDASLLAELDLESLIKQKRRSQYVRIISKQMVGIFLTIWVRRNLRRHIHNLNVSTVGVGAMGYIGNKGSISVSMSIYQTFCCFICTHLTSGERDTDLVKRNADVHEILRRTHFNSHTGIGLPKKILDHERIIWLGDLNYRINLPYEKTRELISKREWSLLVESDQLSKEFKKGRTFGGWTEGTLNFAPTYKYEINSKKYIGEDPKAGRRTPAWCDRILSFGKGIRLLSYRRTELKLSDHRPVTATYTVEVEVFSPKRLQRALTFTDAEIEEEPVITDTGIDTGISRIVVGEDLSYWER